LQHLKCVEDARASWTCKVGAGAACGPTLARRANCGNWLAACNKLQKWSKAGAPVVRGLTNRCAGFGGHHVRSDAAFLLARAGAVIPRHNRAGPAIARECL